MYLSRKVNDSQFTETETNDGWIFGILLRRDPHLLEGTQTGEDAAADPGAVFPFRRRIDFDFDICKCAPLQLRQQTIPEPFIKSAYRNHRLPYKCDCRDSRTIWEKQTDLW